MAISNFKCESCDKVAVCKVYDTLIKFDESQKKQLGVDITIDKCLNFSPDSDEE